MDIDTADLGVEADVRQPDLQGVLGEGLEGERPKVLDKIARLLLVHWVGPKAQDVKLHLPLPFPEVLI